APFEAQRFALTATCVDQPDAVSSPASAVDASLPLLPDLAADFGSVLLFSDSVDREAVEMGGSPAAATLAASVLPCRPSTRARFWLTRLSCAPPADMACLSSGSACSGLPSRV